MRHDIKKIKSYLAKCSFRKCWNILKVISSYYLSIYTKKTIHWGMPYGIMIEPTTSCNLRCPECPSGKREFTRDTGMLEETLFIKTIDELYKDLLYLILYFQGEPYLNKSFFKMVKYASDKGIYVGTSTNAHYLNDENAKKTIASGLDSLIISIDGTTQESYAAYRKGGNLETVIKGVRNLVKWKKEMKSATPYLIIQFVVFKTNEHQLEEIKILSKELGVEELQLKTAEITDYKNGNALIPSIDKYSRYKQAKDGTWVFKNKLPNQCFRMWHSCAITWNGLIVPCCYDKDAQHTLGDLKNQTFATVWKSKTYTNFRVQILKSRATIDICKHCVEGMNEDVRSSVYTNS